MRIWFRGDRQKWWVGLAALAAVGIISQMYLGVRAAEQRVLNPDPALVAEAKALGVEVIKPITVLPPLPMDVQKDNVGTPDKVKLGALLFFDTRLSGDASTACVKCHAPSMGWGESGDMSVGYPGNQHFRNSHTAMNTGYMNKLFWEGRTLSLEAQAGAAGFGGSAGNVQRDMAQARLMQVPEYRKMFKEIFGTEPHWEAISRAIASFQRFGLKTDPKNVPFDRYMMGDDKALTEQQIRGMNLFAGKARCILCHNGPMFTDQDHHMTGVPRPEAYLSDALRQIEVRFRCKSNGITNYGECDDDLGLFFNTHRTADIKRFRTQTLREIKFTAPYMHNGSFFTFEEVIDHYNKGGGDDQGYGTKSKLLKPLNLTDKEKADLVAFLESLSSAELPGKEFSNPKLPGYSNAALD